MQQAPPTVEAASEAAAALRERLAGDPHRPRCHFVPPAGWMNDPNGLVFHGGRYHLFYQHDPDATEGQLMHWGHAVSEDLIHWSDWPLALSPTPGGVDQDGCFSGCCVVVDGRPTIFYTGVIQSGSTLLQRQCLAESHDGMATWVKHRANPIVSAPPAKFDPGNFRDPYVWQGEGRLWMAVGGCTAANSPERRRGAVLLYGSERVDDGWRFAEPLYVASRREEGQVFECPSVVGLGRRDHALIVSPVPQGIPMGYVGRVEKRRFYPQTREPVDGGGVFYAPQVFRDAGGRLIMFGWLKEARSAEASAAAGWSGVMSLPRLMSKGEDGALAFEPAPEVQGLRRERLRVLHEREVDGTLIVDGVSGQSLELVVELQSRGCAWMGVSVRRRPDGSEQTLVGYDPRRRRLMLDLRQSGGQGNTADPVREMPLRVPGGEPLRMHIFVDRSVIEVFAEGRCLSGRMYPEHPAVAEQVAFVAEGGQANLRSLESWRLAPIWPSR